MIAATVANTWRTKGRPATAEDFMPKFQGRRERRSAEEIQAVMTQWAIAHNRRIRKEREKEKKSDGHCRQS